MVADISSISYFLPIFSFLLVFIVSYAVLKKTGILGDNNGVSLFISLIFAAFFIVNTRMVEFTQDISSWFAVFLICMFFILVFLAFIGKDSLKLITENKTVAWGAFVLLIIFFIVSGSRIFKWVLELDKIQSWFFTDWFGMILLVVIGAVVAWVLTKK
jgi:hypothetical protein